MFNEHTTNLSKGLFTSKELMTHCCMWNEPGARNQLLLSFFYSMLLSWKVRSKSIVATNQSFLATNCPEIHCFAFTVLFYLETSFHFYFNIFILFRFPFWHFPLHVMAVMTGWGAGFVPNWQPTAGQVLRLQLRQCGQRHRALHVPDGARM